MLEWLVGFLFLPFLVFLARVADVSLGTIRVIFIAKEMKFVAPVIGFFEILIWLFAIGNIMGNLSNPAVFLAYAAGFAAGTFVGIVIEEKLSIGKVLVQIVSKDNVALVIEQLKLHGYKLTQINAQGVKGEVKFIFTVIERRKVKECIGLVKSVDEQAFYSIEDVKSVSDEGIPQKHGVFDSLKHFHLFRKGK